MSSKILEGFSLQLGANWLRPTCRGYLDYSTLNGEYQSTLKHPQLMSRLNLFEVMDPPAPVIPLHARPSSAISHPRNTEVAMEKRIAVIAMRLLCGLTFAVIAEKLDLRLRSVHRIYTRALERTAENLRESFLDVAKNVRDAPRSGRPSTVPKWFDAFIQLSLEKFGLPSRAVTDCMIGTQMARRTRESISQGHPEPKRPQNRR